MRTTTEPRQIDAALLILLVGFAFSMAANLLWTWNGGVVRILGGALASLALPGAIHLWPRIPVAAPVQVWGCRVPVMRIVRAVAMTGIACMAAFTTFSHASALLVEHGETPLLATLYPVMTELLVVMGVLARHTAPQPQAERAPRKPTVKLRTESSVGTVTPPVVPTETRTELAGVVDLGKPTRGGSRREQIRDYMRTHPDQRPAEVIRGMAGQGIKVPMKEAAEVYRRMQRSGVSA